MLENFGVANCVGAPEEQERLHNACWIVRYDDNIGALFRAHNASVWHDSFFDLQKPQIRSLPQVLAKWELVCYIRHHHFVRICVFKIYGS